MTVAKKHIAKEIAVLLAENTATVGDMLDIFQIVKESLTGYPRFPKPRGYNFGLCRIVVDRTRDDDGIWNK